MDVEVMNRLKTFSLAGLEEEGIELELQDFIHSKKECERSIVGKIFGQRKVNFTGLKNTMTGLWCKYGKLSVRDLGSNLYQFIFSRDEDRTFALKGRPWLFENQFLDTNPWEEGFEKKMELFDKSPVWIQVRNLPIHWINSSIGFKLGQLFEELLDVIVPGPDSRDGNLIKILAVIDLTKPLLRGTRIKYDSTMHWVEFKYEMLPLFCFYCGRIGHSEKDCKLRKKDFKEGVCQEGQFGAWLRTGGGKMEITKSSGIPEIAKGREEWRIKRGEEISMLDEVG